MEKKTLPPLVVPPISSQPLVIQGHGAPITKDLYKAKSAKAIGILQIIGGIVLFTFCLGTAIPQMDENMMAYQIVSCGFCALIGLILCGSFAVCASKKKTPCLIITHMVFCVLLAITLAELWCLSMASMAKSSSRLNDRYPQFRWKRDADDKRPAMPHKPDHSDKNDMKDDHMESWGDKKSGDWHMGGKDWDMGGRKDWGRSRWHKEEYVAGCFEGWDRESRTKISLGCAAVVFIVSLMQFIVTVWGSALACKVTCCEKRGNPVSPIPAYLPQYVELGGNPDVRSKAAISKEQEANAVVQGLDIRELNNPSSPPPAYD